MRVHVHIAELVLTGFDPRDRHRLSDAIERAIVAEIGDGTAVDGIVNRGSREVVAAEDVRHAPRATSSTGHGIGASIGRALRGRSESRHGLQSRNSLGAPGASKGITR
jgi:hypothetical protein